MYEEGVSLDSVIYVSILEVCGMVVEKEVVIDGEFIKDIVFNFVKLIYFYVWRKGYDVDVLVGNIFMKVYKICGSIEDIESLFVGLLYWLMVFWNVMVGVYV